MPHPGEIKMNALEKRIEELRDQMEALIRKAPTDQHKEAVKLGYGMLIEEIQEKLDSDACPT